MPIFDLIILNKFIENYDALKDEIFKIQQTSLTNGTAKAISPPPQAATSQDLFSTSFTDPFGAAKVPQQSFTPDNNINQTKSDFSVDWSNAFDQTNKTNESMTNGFGLSIDPFASFNAAGESNPAPGAVSFDPFNSMAVATKTNNVASNNFDDLWSTKSNTNPTNSLFDNVFAANSNLPASTSFNGFGADDNWATAATQSSKQTNLNNSNENKTNNAQSAANTPNQKFTNIPATDDASNNWAAFDNEGSLNKSFSVYKSKDHLFIKKLNEY